MMGISMRPIPHNPEPQSLAKLQASLPLMRQQLQSARIAALETLDGRLVANFADSWLTEAMLGYAFEAPMTAVVSCVRTGLGELRSAVKVGYRPDSWRMWDYLTFALATADRQSEAFFIEHATERWRDPAARPTLWLSMQIVCVAAMCQGDEEHAQKLLPHIGAELFDKQLPLELKPLVPRIVNEFHLVETLYKRDDGQFNYHLLERMALREAYYRRFERCAPASLIDLEGLGLCRVAQRRGIRPRVEHIYLPLQLLAIAEQSHDSSTGRGSSKHQ